jgi:PTH1 family peptidyl-tRNA hydrolase
VRVILGIGNPGNRYKNNRHNAGFKLLDYFAAKNSLSFIPSKGSYYYCKGNFANIEYCLVKPTTYVNNTGVAAAELVDTLSVGIHDFLIVHDDINLDIGKLKVKLSGGDGGHNGISSVIYHLISNEFTRLRIGVGNSFDKGSMADYVLSDFNHEEEKMLAKVFESGSILLEEFIKGGTKSILDANSIMAGKKKDIQD